MQKIGSKLFAMLLVLCMVFSMMPTIAMADGTATVYNLVTDASELAVGDKVIIVAKDYDYALGTNQKTNNREAVALTKDGNTVSITDTVQVLTLEDGEKEDTFAFYTGSGYLYAASSSSNYLRTEAAKSDNSSWTIEIVDTGVATVKSQGSNTRNWMRYNSASTLFACYASGQQDICIYKLADSEPVRESGIISAADIKDGDKVVIFNPANLKALSTEYSGYYNKGTDVNLTEGVLAGFTDADIWTVGITENNTYTFSTSEGKKFSMGSQYTSTPLDDVNTEWEISNAETDDCYYIKNVVRGNYIEWYADKSNWSSYSSIGSNEALFAQQFYLVVEDEDPDPEDTIVPISTALAASEGSFTVKGVVTLVDGKNIYIQDATGGIDLYLSATPTDIALGDTVIGTGTRAEYKGLPELASATYEKSSGLTLTAKETSIGALTAADVCTYVKLTGVEVTEVYDNNGAYTNPNITVSDGTNSIQLYKALVGKTDGTNWDVQVGDVINVSAAVSIYNTTLQLRNTLASEIEKVRYAKLTDAIADGDQFVVYYNKDSMVMNNTASSNKLTGTAAVPQGEFLSVTGDMAVLTAAVDSDGNYTFTNAEGKFLTSGATGNSLSFADQASDYSLWTLKSVTGGWHIVSVNAAYNGNAQALEVYNSLFTTFSEKDTDYYLFNLYKLTNEKPSENPDTGMPTAGDKVVIYNISSKGVLAAQDDNETSPSITNASAEIVDGKAVVENGGVVFTVEKNGDYYRFKNDTFGYLCSNGTGNNAFYSQTASEDADWTLAEYNGGYTMESRTAKYNGQYSQFMEYYAGAYKTYSMYNVTDKDIYTFQFYPCANEKLTGGIVNEPKVVFGTLPDAFIGTAYDFTFTVESVFGVDSLVVKVGNNVLTANGDGTYTIPAELVAGDSVVITVSGTDVKGVAFTGEASVTVKDEPVIDNVAPAAGSETGVDKRPVISADISNAGDDPTVTMTVNGVEVEAVYENGSVSYTPEDDMADGKVTVTITVTRTDGKSSEKTWSFTVGEAQYKLYFGQLHSHTQYSDGSGTLDAALDYVASLPDSANIDFVAFTDHSNYFDTTGAANPEGALYDMSLASESSQSVWAEYKGKVAEFNESQSDIVALGGFEMTWSGGPGHINTFNTPGIVSRNNATLNNKTADAGMKAYYALLSQSGGAESLSQFNHPGSTFGTFSDFAYWDPVIDTRMYMVEVGNGEGAIGAGGYYPSYEYYTMALDKGWHVAPTNNQDNHKGKWGNANDARDVILTDDFSEEGIYNAIRAMSMYATEDKNLEISYTVNGLYMGSSISEVPENLDIEVSINDPDSSDSISKVEVVVNSGKIAYTWNNQTELAKGTLSVTLDPDYSYYYIRVTEGDGDIAVTAPVWVGESLKLGISSVECGTSTPVTDEELTLTTTLFNSEAADATVKSITYTCGEAVLGTDTTEKTIPASGTLAVDFKYTPDTARVMTITVTAVVEQDGKEYTFTKDIELDVLDASKLVYIGIDASHHNEYVAGNYKDSMGNFGNLAAGYSVRTVQLNTSEDLIAACMNDKYKAIVLTAPSRRDGSALRDPYDTYSDAEVDALVAFNNAGGTVILCGWGDYYESYSSFSQEDHMSAQQNKILAALGSSIRISDDETKDNTWNGGQSQRLYLSSYNFDSFLLNGVEYDAENPHNNMYTELYSQYGGASIYVVDTAGNAISTVPSTVTPVVYGFDTTYSSDDDKDNYGGLGSIPKYSFDGADRLMVMATEQLEGKGLIVVSGAAFLSNFEVQATISDSGAEKNYSNYKICENLLRYINPVTVTDIATVQKQTEVGYKYTIEGVVTSNASGYDKDTAFFDCIYVQDETGGICCFPVAGNFKIGDKVRITGTTDFYQGEAELQVTSIELISEGHEVTPKEATAKQINDGSVLGSLITLKGKVVSYELENGLVQTIMVKDADGDVARVFIDGYITTDKDVENLEIGCNITVTGLASYDNTFNAPEGPFPRIRIRNRADVVCTEGEDDPKPVIPPTPVEPFKFTDVPAGAWYEDAVYALYNRGIIEGISATEFGPGLTLNRAMMVTLLYRLSGETYTGEVSGFTDVKDGMWYTDAVNWAAANGVVKGVTETTYCPETPVTREQAVAMIYRYAQYKGYDVSKTMLLDGFTDADTVSGYAVAPMQWAVASGIITGRGNNLIAPRATSTRAEAVTMLQRFIDTVK